MQENATTRIYLVGEPEDPFTVQGSLEYIYGRLRFEDYIEVTTLDHIPVIINTRHVAYITEG